MKQSQIQQLSQKFFESIPQLVQIEAPIKIQQFEQKSECRDLQTQYQLLKAITETKKHKLKLRTNSVLQNKLNRYSQLEIYQFSRIILKKNTSNIAKGKQMDYINANYVSEFPDKIIITQGPLPNTLQDFALMIKQQQIKNILMLCNLIQDGKVRCENYYENLKQYQIIQVQQSFRGIIKRTLKNIETKEIIHHMQYLDWPDKGVPQDFQGIEQLLSLMRNKNNLLIHCSAGIGRSGTIMVLLNCLKDLENSKQVNIFKHARKLRERRYGAIQNNYQYIFIYDFLKYYIRKNYKKT